MSKRTRNRLTSQEKVAILRLHLLEHTPVSDLCDKHGIRPTMFYRWQKELFENAATSFERRNGRDGDGKDRKIVLLEQKLQRKHEVLSELMEEHIKLKKNLGSSERDLGSPSNPRFDCSVHPALDQPHWPIADGLDRMAGNRLEQVRSMEPTAGNS
jgi:transposase